MFCTIITGWLNDDKCLFFVFFVPLNHTGIKYLVLDLGVSIKVKPFDL